MGLTHEEIIVNEDALCTIDTKTRKITSNSGKTTFLQYDHNSERIGFTMNRYIDGHDMSSVDRVAIKYLNRPDSDMYIVDDLKVSDDGNSIDFTWLISGNVTSNSGPVIFLINFRCYDDEGRITYNWSTQPCSTYTILEGVYSMDNNPEEQYDFWAKYEGLVNEVVEKTNITQNKINVLNKEINEIDEEASVLASDLTETKGLSEVLDNTVGDLSYRTSVLEDKTEIMETIVPELESRVDALDRTLDEDPIHAVNLELSEVKNALVSQGRIIPDIKYGTAYSGILTEDDDMSAYRLITPDMIDCSTGIRIVNGMSSDYRFGIIYYEEDTSWSNADPGWMDYSEYDLRNYGYARFNFSKKDNSELTDSDITYIQANFEIYRTDLNFAKDDEFVDAERLINAVVERYNYNDYDILMNGTISGGQISVGSQIRCCTMTHIRVKPGMWIHFNATNYYYGVACFDENKVYDGVDHGWTQQDFYIDFDGYILMNFRTATDSVITETDVANIKNICYIENYIKYSDWFNDDLNKSINDAVDNVKADVSREQAIGSILVEYGRVEGASYVYCRIPKTLNNGLNIVPKVRLTSADSSLSGGKRSALTYARANNSIFTINAGLFDMTSYEPVGQTIIDGVSITNTPMTDDNGIAISDTQCYPLCIDADGTLSAPYDRSISTDTMIADGIVQAITGWGKLVENFAITSEDIAAEIVHPGKYIRQSIGQYQNGDYAICTVDQSRGTVENEAGLTYEALAQIFVDHGVKFAYSLDGGGSAETVIGNRQLNPIYEGSAGRAVPTVISFEVNE